ncbi:hypothetical protein PF005_g31224 [Phytophthora fragariae]|uniref:Uncharacterized protein n=1 Tax=Phytophthora fragariae TaxID=53985 RepID=A0A6A3EJD2_9STRA|nr:hypothetical protein PF009_g19663 [Phytophthora fragariae]KAE9059398.1 hypothetical protein PF007_g30972 [Phytophthora fragariae]KAE9161492.1 hypothetical protein PF005_g31224 [Phytophthora fragariae]
MNPRLCVEYSEIAEYEKWFYVKNVGKHVYIWTGKDDVLSEEPPVQFVQSKRHIKKVMFLCAVARPRGDWDGKVGIWRVVKNYKMPLISMSFFTKCLSFP